MSIWYTYLPYQCQDMMTPLKLMLLWGISLLIYIPNLFFGSVNFVDWIIYFSQLLFFCQLLLIIFKVYLCDCCFMKYFQIAASQKTFLCIKTLILHFTFHHWFDVEYVSSCLRSVVFLCRIVIDIMKVGYH